MNKSELENTKEILNNIISQPVETMELEEQILPQIEDLNYSNKSYKVKCSILFIDIRQSTQLSKDLMDKSMLKIYKSFIRMATQCVRYAGGYTRQFLGDRIMGIFLDELNEEGKTVEKSSNKAVKAAREMNTYIDYVLNNLINKNINGKYIKCGIGICTGKVLLAQVGMKGIEQDNEKQNEKGDVWVGYITNQASKFADLTLPREIFIDENTYKELNEENMEYNHKFLWEKDRRYKGNKKYEGYISKDLYVPNIEELQLAKFEYEDDEINKKEHMNYQALLQGVEEIIEKYKMREVNILQKEKELKERDEKLTKRENDLSRSIKKNEYDLLYDVIYHTYLHTVKVKEMGRAYWLDIIDRLIKKGNEIGKNKNEIIEDLSIPLMEIYMELDMYEEAYNTLVIHSRTFSYFPYNGMEVIKKAKLKNQVLKALKEKVYTIQDTNSRMNMLDEIKKIENIVF